MAGQIRYEAIRNLLSPPSHFLIAINPACEVWLLERTAELGKTPADFGLSNDFEAFKAFRK